MKSIFAFLCAVLLFSCAKEADFHKEDLAVLLEQAKQSDQKILIDFWSDG